MKSLTLRSAITAIICSLSYAAAAYADPKAVDVPAGDLIVALESLAKQSGVEFVYQSNQLKGLRTEGVKGAYAPKDAISLLLKGTPLTVRTDETGAIMIAPPRVERPAKSTSALTDGAEEFHGGQEQRVDPDERFRLAQVDRESSAAVPSIGQSDTLAGKDNNRIELEEIIVTGSHIRGVAPVGSNVIVIDREQIKASGYSTASEIIRSLPQSFNGGVSPDTGLSRASSPDQDTGIDLRGFGNGTTLVLVNGRRLAPGGTRGNVVGVSSIPLTAVDHIDVLPDGASALYGSDAIGGVVNYVLKSQVSGAESSVRYGNVTDGDRREYQLAQNFGIDWEGGNLLVAGEYYDAEPLLLRDRPRALADSRPYGGADLRGRFCNPGTIVAGGQTYAIPAGQDGTSLDPVDLVPGTQNRCDPLASAYLYPDERRYNLFTTAKHSLTSNLEIFADVSYANRRVQNTNTKQAQLLIPSSNAFYVNPTGGTGPIQVTYDFRSAFGEYADSRYTTKQLNAAVGTDFSLARDWKVSSYVGTSSVDSNSPPYLNLGGPTGLSLRAALADSNEATAFNPFGDLAIQNPATIAGLFAANNTRYRQESDLLLTSIIASGPLLRLPAGLAKMAFGVEYRELTGDTDQTTTADSNVSHFAVHLERTVESAFAELFLPVFNDSNGVRGVRRLEFSAAGRYEDYSDFGDALVPRVGATWSPVRGLNIRSTWSKSFRVPDLTDLDETNNNTSIPDLVSPNGNGLVGVLFIQGNNEDLQEETARTWTVGFDVKPETISGLTFGATYFDIEYTNRIGKVETFDLSSPVLQPVLIANPTAEQRAYACSLRFVGNFSTVAPGSCLTAPVGYLIDTRLRNLGALENRGVDVNGAYGFSTSWADVNLAATATYLVDYGIQTTRAATVVDVSDTAAFPPKFRLRASAGVSRGRTSAVLFANYQDDYRSTATASSAQPAYRVGSWLTFDVNLSHDFSIGNNGDVLAGLSVSLNAHNLFDREPPIYLSPIRGSYDAVNADLLGRTVSVSVTKAW